MIRSRASSRSSRSTESEPGWRLGVRSARRSARACSSPVCSAVAAVSASICSTPDPDIERMFDSLMGPYPRSSAMSQDIGDSSLHQDIGDTPQVLVGDTSTARLGQWRPPKPMGPRARIPAEEVAARGLRRGADRQSTRTPSASGPVRSSALRFHASRLRRGFGAMPGKSGPTPSNSRPAAGSRRSTSTTRVARREAASPAPAPPRPVCAPQPTRRERADRPVPWLPRPAGGTAG